MAERDDNEDVEIIRKPGDSFEGHCDFCHYETTVTRYRSMALLDGNERAKQNRLMGDTEKDFCEVCASTPASICHNYPNQFPDAQGHVLRTIAYTTNMILDAIKNNKLG